MPVDVQTAIEIRCPRERVAAFAGDPDNAPLWYTNISSVTWETDPPLAVGSRVAFVAHFLRRRIAYTYEVRELVPAERLVMSTAQGPFPMRTTYEWRDVADGGTVMTLRNDGEPAGLGAMAAPLVARAVRRATTRDLRTLKRILETPGS